MSDDDTIQLTPKGSLAASIINVANLAVGAMQDSLDDLAERYGAEITDYEELVRALRAQVEFHRYVAAGRAERLDEMEQDLRDAQESNGNLRAMLQTAKAKRKRTPQEEAEWLEDKRSEYEADRCCGHHWGNI